MRTSGYAVNGFANHTLPYSHTLSLQRCPTLPYLTIANSQLRPAPECIAQKLGRFIIDNSVHDRAFVVAVLHAYPQRQCDGSRSRKEFNPEEIALAICRRRLLAARRFAQFCHVMLSLCSFRLCIKLKSALSLRSIEANCLSCQFSCCNGYRVFLVTIEPRRFHAPQRGRSTLLDITAGSCFRKIYTNNVYLVCWISLFLCPNTRTGRPYYSWSKTLGPQVRSSTSIKSSRPSRLLKNYCPSTRRSCTVNDVFSTI